MIGPLTVLSYGSRNICSYGTGYLFVIVLFSGYNTVKMYFSMILKNQVKKEQTFVT
jgi:hypothetical protein